MSSYNGTGTFQISGTGLPYVAGTTISDTVGNQLNTDLAAGLTNCLCKDGQQTATAVIPFAQGISVGGGSTVSTINSGGFVPTDQSGASLSFTVSRAVYTQVGTRIWVELTLTFPSTASGATATIGLGSLPNCANVSGVGGSWMIYFGNALLLQGQLNQGTNTFIIFNGASSVVNSALTGTTLRMQFNYATV